MKKLSTLIYNYKLYINSKRTVKWARLSLTQAENNHEDVEFLVMKLNTYVIACDLHKEQITRTFGKFSFIFK